MKIAFLILAHNNFNDLYDLCRFLIKDKDHVFIHIDKKVSVFDYRFFQELASQSDYIHLIERKDSYKCKWGHLSLVKATLRLIETAINHSDCFDYYSLHSGVDYPIKKVSTFKAFLSKNKNKQYIEAYSMLFDNWLITNDDIQERYKYYWFFFKNRTIEKWLNKLFRVKRELPYSMLPYSGSQWWTLSHSGVKTLLKASHDKKIMDFMKKVYISDEMFCSTVIMNSALKSSVEYCNLREIVWLEAGTPKNMTILDYKYLLSSEAFFARKISDSSLKSMINNSLSR